MSRYFTDVGYEERPHLYVRSLDFPVASSVWCRRWCTKVLLFFIKPIMNRIIKLLHRHFQSYYKSILLFTTKFVHLVMWIRFYIKLIISTPSTSICSYIFVHPIINKILYLFNYHISVIIYFYPSLVWETGSLFERNIVFHTRHSMCRRGEGLKRGGNSTTR